MIASDLQIRTIERGVQRSEAKKIRVGTQYSSPCILAVRIQEAHELRRMFKHELASGAEALGERRQYSVLGRAMDTGYEKA